MAPLRTSRQTRNQDHAAARSRTGVVDLDPTDGLPVTKWSQISVRVNQETDFTTLNTPSANVTDWNAQFNTSQYPWPEPERPSFIKDLPSWNQEMLRRSRIGSTNVKLSVWDRKSNSWISAAEAEKKSSSAKQQEQTNQETNNQNANGHDSPKSDHESEAENDKSEDEDMADDDNPLFKTATVANKRRKTGTARHLEPRIFEVKKWVQVPMAVAEKVSEPKFLADRRPGMPALYNPVYQNTVFGSYLSSNQPSVGANYDLGDGGGLGNATGVLGSNGPMEPVAPPTPVRKNMPPRRKKKKIGGPGRKKANPVPTNVDGESLQAQGGPQAGTNGSALTTAGSGEASNEISGAKDVVMGEAASHDDDEEGSESGSEEEGSEEGEIDEVDAGMETKAELAGNVVQQAVELAAQPSDQHEDMALSPAPQNPTEILEEGVQLKDHAEPPSSAAITSISETALAPVEATSISAVDESSTAENALTASGASETDIVQQEPTAPKMPLAPQTIEPTPAAAEETSAFAPATEPTDAVSTSIVNEPVQSDSDLAVSENTAAIVSPLGLHPEPVSSSAQTQIPGLGGDEYSAQEAPATGSSAPNEGTSNAAAVEVPVVATTQTDKNDGAGGGQDQARDVPADTSEGSDLLGGLDAAIDKDMSGT